MADLYSVGIDTSNYKTSVAVVNSNGEIIIDKRKFLSVKKGERGLRQSAALFQHVNNLPQLISEVLSQIDKSKIVAVSASSKPRPLEGSYMPVFNAGVSFARVLSDALEVPYYEFSHQEGHITAVKEYSPLRDTTEDFIAFHFSGGTSEALLINDSINIIGGSKDISYGQVIDRVGVSLGMEFPCGQELDEMTNYKENLINGNPLSKIKVNSGYVNLSGIETQCQRLIDITEKDTLVSSMFQRISESICEVIIQLSEIYSIKNFLFVGGVSSSKYIRNYVKSHLNQDLNIYFGNEDLSSDNAVGIGILGGKHYGR